MRQLLIYLKDYKKECVLAPLFKMLEAIFELFVPVVMALVIDVGIAGKDIPYIIKMCMVLVILGIVGLVCSVTAQYFSAKAAAGFGTNVRHALFSHIESLSFSSLDKVGTSTLITRMTSDVNQAQNGVNMTLRLFLRSPFVVLGALAAAFLIDAKTALIFAVTIPALSLAVFAVMRVGIPLYRNVQGLLDSVTLSVRENLTGVRVIRAFRLEEEETASFREKNKELSAMQIFVGKISGLMNPATYVMINGATAYLIYAGAIQVDSGVLTQGEVVALVNYMGQILVELVKFANLIVTVTKGIACGNRIFSVFEIPADRRVPVKEAAKKAADGGCAKGHAGGAAVAFSHVGLTYEGSKEEALSDVSFSAKKGETIGIIGGTGSGKSSLVNLIPGFYPHTRGCIWIDGKEIASYSKETLRSKIGVVPQKPVLFAGTIRDNLLWGNSSATDGELLEALEIAQASDIIEKKEGGLSAEVSQGGKNFSGGQRQRLTIARALVKKPEILILDDSSSALDYATDAALRQALAGMKDRPTVFIVSQRASSVQHADRILVLDDGELKGAGTHESLLKDCETYREIYDSQFKEER